MLLVLLLLLRLLLLLLLLLPLLLLLLLLLLLEALFTSADLDNPVTILLLYMATVARRASWSLEERRSNTRPWSLEERRSKSVLRRCRPKGGCIALLLRNVRFCPRIFPTISKHPRKLPEASLIRRRKFFKSHPLPTKRHTWHCPNEPIAF